MRDCYPGRFTPTESGLEIVDLGAGDTNLLSREVFTSDISIEVRVGQPNAAAGGRPEAPHTAVTDNDYRSGFVGFGSRRVEGNPVLITGVTLQVGATPDREAFRLGDANDDARVDLNDAVFSFTYLFLGGSAPPAPGPNACGPDPTADTLPRCEYPSELCGA